MLKPPTFDTSFEELPSDPKQRREALLDLFGQDIFWMRNWLLAQVHKNIESPEVRQRLATILRKPYDQVAELDTSQRAAAFELAKVSVDNFIRFYIWCSGGESLDRRLDERYALRFKLTAEVCDVKSGEVVLEEPLNWKTPRGVKYIGAYFGRWLNRYAREPVKKG